MNYRSRLALLLLPLVVACLPAHAASSTQEAALEFVQRQGVGATLPDMARNAVMRSKAYPMIVTALGEAGAKAAVQRELDALLPAYQPKWNSNLADAYARNFTATELTSLAAQGSASPYSSKVSDRQAAVGSDMRHASEHLLGELVRQTLTNVAAKLPK